jgi:hypothetical protein
MADTKAAKYERARGLAHDALTEYAKGDKTRGEQLAEQAVKTDRDAVEDLVREVEQRGRIAQ